MRWALLRNGWPLFHRKSNLTLLVRVALNLLLVKLGSTWDFLNPSDQTGSVLGRLLRNGWVIEPSCLAGTVSLRICHKLTTKQDQLFLHALPNPDPFCAKNLHSPTRPWEGCVYKWYWVPSGLDNILYLKFAIC